MDADQKIKWLKRVLVFKILVVVLLWALPAWIAPASILQVFGVEMPADPFFMRMFGATQIGLAFLFWLALQDPVRNRDMIRYGVVDNAVAFVTILGVALTTGITNPTIWLSAGLVLFFAIAFYVLMPKAV